MADLTKCMGKNCKIKNNCKRYLVKSSKIQSWFDKSPIKESKCDYQIKITK